MDAERFFDLLEQEILAHPKLRDYYRFHDSPKKYAWRKAYFCQRLEYIARQIKGRQYIWDVGCGYGTTGIFLALNGYRVHGSTLEYYFSEIPARLAWWKPYGDVSGFSYDYADLHEATYDGQFDAVIVQDTIHHTEPIEGALRILHAALRPGGWMIVVEENGSNLVQRARLFLQRGNRRIIEIYDEKLKKHLLLGNENIRSFPEWTALFRAAGFAISSDSLHYVRVLPPQLFGRYHTSIELEQSLWPRSRWLRDYFFFGLSFCARKAVPSEGWGAPAFTDAVGAV
jgi:SAM-dependent methyltransferase